MHQGRGLERVIGAFVAELRSCQRAEFIVDQREKPLHRGLRLSPRMPANIWVTRRVEEGFIP